MRRHNPSLPIPAASSRLQKPKYCRIGAILKQNFTHLIDIAAIQVETDENTDQCRLALGKKIAPGRFQPRHGAVFAMAAATYRGE
jgi:hypothetical protein